MADDNSADAGANQNPAAQQEPPKTYTQDDFNALDAKLRREYKAKEKALKDKADQWDQYEQSKKTESQRTAEEKEALAKENAALKASIELDKAKRKSGRKHNIPEADWDRLRGSTSEEIEADAKEWAKTRGLDKAGGPTPQGGAGTARHPFNQAFLQATGHGGR